MELHTRIHGSGPPLILLHGLFGSGDNLGSLARGLVDDFTVHAMDLRNHGRSPHADAMDHATLAADVFETMDAHGLETVRVLGHSLGGKAAMEMALTAPQRVRALVVLDIAPVAYGHHHDTELAAMRDLDPDRFASRGEIDEALAAAIPVPAVRQFLLKNLVREGNGFGWRIPLDTIAEQYESIAAAPSPGQYDGPTLFIRGGRSDYIRTEHEEAIRSRFPRARIETVPAAAHWLHVEDPERVTTLVQEFLSGVETANGHG